MAKKIGSVRFVETDMARLYECHCFIVSITNTRNGLIAAYRAAKETLPPLLLAQLVTAIREKQEEFITRDRVATNGK